MRSPHDDSGYRIWILAAFLVAFDDARTMSMLHTAGHYVFLALLLGFALRLLYVTVTER